MADKVDSPIVPVIVHIFRVWTFIFTYIVAPVAILTSIGLVGLGVRDLHRSHDSRTWPASEGRIDSSSVVIHDSGPDSEGDNGLEARIDYHYVVNGKSYTSSRIAFGWFTYTTPPAAKKKVSLYPKGATVSVRYMPSDPSTAVLEPGINWQVVFAPLFGGLSAVVFLWVLFRLPGFVSRRLARYSNP